MNTAYHSTPRTSTSELRLTLWTATPLEHSKNYWYTLKTCWYHQNSLLIHPQCGQSERNNFWGILHLLRCPSGLCSCIQPFNTATYRILNNTTQALTLGVNYDDSGQLITDLDYADNVVIFADLFDTLKEALFIFNEQSQKLGLHVNWSRTKLQ